MKTKTKIGLISTFSLMFLSLFIVPSAYAGSCNNNAGDGNYCHSTVKINQTEEEEKTNFEFTARVSNWDRDNGYYVRGYNITVDCFPDLTCNWGDDDEHHWSVNVTANGASVAPGTEMTIDVEFWLNKSGNSIHTGNNHWTPTGGGGKLAQEYKAFPDNGWCIYGNILTIFNDDDTDNFTISGLGYYVDTALYFNLETIVFDMPIPGQFTLLPGGNRTFNISLGGITKRYVYFHYIMLNATGGVLAEEYAAHEMQSTVGGIWVPVDKLALLAPYIALVSTILVATAATAIYVKRRNKKQ